MLWVLCDGPIFKMGQKINFSSPVSLKIPALSKIKARGVDAHPVHLKKHGAITTFLHTVHEIENKV
jgi:hypothetical protein